MDYDFSIPTEDIDSILIKDEAILDEQMEKFAKISEEISPLSELFACAANAASVY